MGTLFCNASCRIEPNPYRVRIEKGTGPELDLPRRPCRRYFAKFPQSSRKGPAKLFGFVRKAPPRFPQMCRTNSFRAGQQNMQSALLPQNRCSCYELNTAHLNQNNTTFRRADYCPTCLWISWCLIVATQRLSKVETVWAVSKPINPSRSMCLT